MLIYAAIIVAIVLRFVLPRWQKAPPNRFIAILARPRGIDAPVPGAVWVRTDYLKAARLTAFAAAGLAALTWIAEVVGERSINGSTVNLIASGFLLIGTIGFVMAVVMVIVHLVRAARAKSGSA
jgi:hypothetical protein